MRRLRNWLWLAAAVAAPAIADDGAAALQRMGRALSEASYRGEVVFLRDGQLDALRIRHGGALTGAVEQMERLTGPALPLRRDAYGVSLGDGPAWLAGNAGVAVATIEPDLILKSYEVVVVGEDRVAGRATQVVDARARDGARYARRYWIDLDSGLLLRSAVFGADGIAVEQWMFANVEIDATATVETPPAAAAPSRDFRAVNRSDLATARAEVLDVPAGFQLIAAAVEPQGEQLVYSDGLAKVSVFVEGLGSGQAVLSGLQRRGALSIFGRVLDGAQIVVVGEVPPNTAERFAQGVARRPAP